MLKSVVHQLPGGHGSPLKKTFEGEAMMERGREEGPSWYAAVNYGGKQGEDLRILQY